eukprot:TRINITY_DN362_c1_g1_i1.p1 TRINITY_DN362_c1_g1~~TRINITY_DN362_c1_g1_i1.p1  ORF type:complete len:302 (+),score=54.01 TRINITY_DN362_c1_g1_i1:102-1007(+)
MSGIPAAFRNRVASAKSAGSCPSAGSASSSSAPVACGGCGGFPCSAGSGLPTAGAGGIPDMAAMMASMTAMQGMQGMQGMMGMPGFGGAGFGATGGLPSMPAMPTMPSIVPAGAKAGGLRPPKADEPGVVQSEADWNPDDSYRPQVKLSVPEGVILGPATVKQTEEGVSIGSIPDKKADGAELSLDEMIRLAGKRVNDLGGYQKIGYGRKADEERGIQRGRVQVSRVINAPYANPNAGKGGDGGVRPGDWTCPKCGANVFAGKPTCYRCNGPKPEEGEGEGEGGCGGGAYQGGMGSMGPMY